MSKLDLAGLDVKATGDKTAVLKLRNPYTDEILANDDGTVWELDMVSADSDDYRQAQRKVMDRRIQQNLRTRRPKINADTVDADALELQVVCTKGWRGLIENEKPVEFTEENVKRVYGQYSWIREQVSEFINDRANFLGN